MKVIHLIPVSSNLLSWWFLGRIATCFSYINLVLVTCSQEDNNLIKVVARQQMYCSSANGASFQKKPLRFEAV